MNFSNELKSVIENAVKILLQEKNISEAAYTVSLEVPKNKEYGDLATNIALSLSRILKSNPMTIAEEILKHFIKPDFIEQIQIAKPGFINFIFTKTSSGDILKTIAAEGKKYGRVDIGKGKSALVEFVSANPTGPLHIGHARNVVVGDSIAKLLEAGGYKVTREYYFNDAGVQMEKLGESTRARYLQQIGIECQFPEDGYCGNYLIEIAKDLVNEVGESWKDKTDLKDFTRYASQKIIKMIDDDLKTMDIKFDSWINESDLHKNGKVQETIDELKKLDMLYEQDGAVWLKSSLFGDEKDRVLIKTDGNFTYVVPDIAYHRLKYERGFDKIVDIFGGDHHGYFPRLKAAMEALKLDSSKLKFVIYQMVTVIKNGEPMRLSKRAGEIITLREMVEELGVDVVRFFLNMRSPDSQLIFDWGLAMTHSEENPVFYIQYAHARVCSIFRKAEEAGFKWGGIETTNLARLELAEEQDLIKYLAQFPQAVTAAVNFLEPQHITFYASTLAQMFNQYYTMGIKDKSYRIIQPDDKELTYARLSLADCLKTVIANSLSILGISAPEAM